MRPNFQAVTKSAKVCGNRLRWSQWQGSAVASSIIRLIGSTWPFVQGWLGYVQAGA